jgi:hypothetical protein
MARMTVKPLALADGTVSRDHLYYSFIRDDQMVTFAIPKVVVAPVAISACRALMPGWRYVDREDSTYGPNGSAEDIQRWRSEFLRQLDSTCLTTERALSYVDADTLAS